MNRSIALDDPELQSLLPAVPFTRRGFLVSGLAVGFALAAHPVMAQSVITTSAAGLEAGETKIPVSDGVIPAYYAAPEKAGRYPVILVVQEIFGVHEHIRDVCRRFAKLGYFAVAPELYARQGDVSGLTDIAAIRVVVEKVPDSQVMSDLDAAADWAGKHAKGDADKLGITGFCWGGRVVWLYAAHNPKLDAGVAWYGRLVGDATPNTPTHPIDLATQLKAPVLGLYGGADQGIPIDTVERMRAALKAAGKPGEIVVYPDAPHAFNADYRPSYRKEVAEDAWQRAIDWFKQHGVA